MKQNKKGPIIIKKIRTFAEINKIELYINNYYGGVMQIDMYNKFLKYTTDPYLRKYFIKTFKRKLQTKDIKPVHKDSPDQTVNIREKYIPIKIKNSPEQNIITVSPSDFSFHHTPAGSPRLVYKDSECFFMGKTEWFNPEVLELVNREFKIKLRDYIGFSFVPIEDKQVFENLLKDTYNRYLKNLYTKELKECFWQIDYNLQQEIKNYSKSYQSISISIPLNNFIINEDSKMYTVNIDCFDYIDLKSGITEIFFSYYDILTMVDKRMLSKYPTEIENKWRNGYLRQLEIKDILPNFKTSLVEIKVPDIYVKRYGINDTIDVNLRYSVIDGKYAGNLPERNFGLSQRNTTPPISFSDVTKTALKEVFSQIDSPFLITFYTSYVRMFREDIQEIKGLFKTQLKILEEYDEMLGYPLIPESTRYYSGYCPLIEFDPSVPNSWLWLTSLINNGISKIAYVFTDKNSTFSSKHRLTKNYPVKVYISVEDVSGYYRYIFDPMTHFTLSMYALDTSKSTYRFIVIQEKLNEAIFFLWSYFSSNNYNKREEFYKVLKYGKFFGIISFRKDMPLVYKPGLGFCENNWP